MVVDDFVANQQAIELGGPGKIVQIDESKFGKQKYNHRRCVEGQSVLGMIEDACDDIMVVVDTRDSVTLTETIRRYLLPGRESTLIAGGAMITLVTTIIYINVLITVTISIGLSL